MLLSYSGARSRRSDALTFTDNQKVRSETSHLRLPVRFVSARNPVAYTGCIQTGDLNPCVTYYDEELDSKSTYLTVQLATVENLLWN